MSHAAIIVFAVFSAAALRSVKRLIDGAHNIGHGNLLHRTRHAITTTGTAHTLHQIIAAQLAEQLL